MNDDDLTRLVASTSPVDDGDVDQLSRSGPATDLPEAIMSTPRTTDLAAPPSRRSPSRLLTPVAAVVALVVGFLAFQQLSPSDDAAWAAEVVAVAEAAPRYLVDDDAWTVTRAGQFTPTDGEMTFSDGERELDLHWRSGDHEGWVGDRRASADLEEQAMVGSHEAVVFRYEAGPPPEPGVVFGDGDPVVEGDDLTALWREGDHTVEARGVFADVGAFRDVLADLTTVDVDTWLEALPASVVKPDSRAAVVEAMLADIPTPPGFERRALDEGDGVLERYHVGADVTGAVACGWIAEWLDATDAGDTARTERAVEAMATSKEWDVLQEMVDEGDWSEVVWEYADAMATGGTVPGGRPLTVEESYVDALGCDQP